LYDDTDRQRRAADNARAVYERRFVGENVYGDMCDYLETVAMQGRSPFAAVRRDQTVRSRDNDEARV